MEWEMGKGNGTDKYLKRLHAFVPTLMKIFMIESYRRITIATPVDTGRARFGWYCSVNKIDYGIPAAGQYQIDHARAGNAFASITEADTLYIANSVPYIARLNSGTSRQAPARFAQISFENSVKALQTYIRQQGMDVVSNPPNSIT